MRLILGAKALIVDPEEQVLVLTRSNFGDRPDILAHEPDLPGGKVEADESGVAAVIRELQEEIAVTVPRDALRLVYAKTGAYQDASITLLFFVARLAERPEVKLSFEHEAFTWCPLDQLLDSYRFRPFYQEAISYGLEHGLID